MSEINETPKFFKMIKAIPGNVILNVHSFANPQLSKLVYLTDRNPYQNLPLDWALGVFIDDECYGLYKKGIITFDDNTTLAKLAYENGAYFSEELEFEPADQDTTKKILAILASGNRQKILDAADKYGKDVVKLVALENVNDLTQGVVSLLEGIFHVQFTADGGSNE